MASVQERSGKFRIQFYFNGSRQSLNLGQVPARVAESKSAKIEEILAFLDSGYLKLPDGTNIVEFVKHDGKPPLPSAAPELEQTKTTLGSLRDRYLATCEGSVESNTLGLFRTHFKTLAKTFGSEFVLQGLDLAALQRHADRRKSQVSPTTIRKEFSTLRAAWNWGASMNLVTGVFPPVRRVKLPKLDEKPPFMTWAEAEKSGMWDALYLSVSETADLLEVVKATAVQPWVYPMCSLAAFTGMRRSELLRALIADVDFSDGVITVRERKRARTQRTTRRIPIAPPLHAILKEWISIHPGGAYLFAQHKVVRSKKSRKAPSPVTKDEAHDHLKRAISGSKWQVVKGFHLLRHSFISACASKGIDQRFIDEWTGHSTEEQRRRYRHLFPSSQQEAIGKVFSF